MNKMLFPLILLTSVINSTHGQVSEQVGEQGIVQAIPQENAGPNPADQALNQPTFNDQIDYFISTNGIRVRATPDLTGKVLGMLGLNDKVKVINPTIIYNQKYVEIKIVSTYDKITPSDRYFISIDVLSAVKVDYKEFVGKYFVVVNVATETLRLYERVCPDNSCPNKMLIETEVVVGEDRNHPKDEDGKGRSLLGSYRVTGWTKFYQDPEGHYPAWYRDGSPDLPKPNSDFGEWFEKKIMPYNEYGKREGKMRGAFGWYTAFVEPKAYGQWTHGTVGWGEDKDIFVKKVKKPLINVVSNPRSSGCTRNNNEAIAFIRSLIEIGAPIVKIYAQEEILDPTYSDYPELVKEWNYVLTKTKNHAIERDVVLKSLGITDSDLDTYWGAKRAGGELILDPKSPLNQILEVGSYSVDVHPDIIEFTPGEKLGRFSRKIGRKGNVYGIKSKDMHGVFYADAGMLDGYAHPDSVVEASGFKDEVTPPWMKLSNLKK
ncbi:MAG: L,D-transpeptidase [Bacteriovorax sp.]|nr:L,D-transpeptidase [Bacteriovorax sp.]